VRGHEVVPVEPREEPDLHVVQRRARAEVVEALLTHRAPEALHLAARLRVVRLGVQQPDTEAAARGAQRLADVRRSVVQVQRVGRAVQPERFDEQPQHLDLALGRARLQRDDVAAVVVQDRVDAQRHAFAVDPQRGAVTDVGVPERIRRGGLPAPARLAVVLREAGAIEAVLGEEPPYSRLADGAALDATVGLERAQDERGAHSRVLAADREQQVTLRVGELPRVSGVASPLGAQRSEPAGAVGVEPALEGRHRVGPGPRGAGRAEALGAQLAQGLGQLAVGERTTA